MDAVTTGRAKAAMPPRLRAAGFAAFKTLWFALLALAVVAPVAGVWVRASYVERNSAPFERAGLALDFPGGKLRLAEPYTEEARRSGIAAGDRIVAVDGRTVSDDLAARPTIAALLRGPEGSRVRVRTRSAAGAERDHLLTRSQATVDRDFAGSGISFDAYQTLRVAIGSLPPFFLVGASVLLFRRRSRDLAPALLSLSFLAASATVRNASYFYWEIGAVRAADALSIAGWELFILVLLIFPNGRFAQRWAPWVALLVVADGIAAYFFLLPPAIPTWTGLLFAALASLMVRYRRLPAGPERQQIRWALLGFAAGAGAAGAADAVTMLIVYFGLDPVRIWAPLIGFAFLVLAEIFFAAGLLVSLLKYRLYDADAVISRSAGYAVLTLMLGAAFGASAKAIELLFETGFGRDAGAWPGVIGAALAVVLITPLHGRVHGWAERRFQKALMKMRRDLPPCVEDLRETAGMADLLAEIVDRIARGVRASRIAVLLDGKVAAGRGLETGNAVPDLPEGASGLIVDHRDSLFPLRIPLASGHRADDAPVGWLLLGPRPDGSLYGKDELEALHAIVDPVARAVRIVQLREARERGTRAGAARQNRRIAALERAMAALTARPTEAPA